MGAFRGAVFSGMEKRMKMLTLKSQLELIAIGSSVMIGGDISAQVIACCIRGTGVTYQVTWWDERDFRSGWFDSFQVRCKEGCEIQSVGFKGSENEGGSDG